MMILHRPAFTNACRGIRLALALLAASLVGAVACSKDDPVQNGEPLCPGESGVGIRVEGRAENVDVCVSDAAVDALLTSSDHYDVSAQATTDAGNTFQIRMVFTKRPDFPVSLRLVNSITEVEFDPDAAYVYYEELPEGGTPIESGAILGGKFRLTFSDDTVAAGTLENITMNMQSVLNGDPAGTRKIVEGFFSVSVEPPVSTLSVR